MAITIRQRFEVLKRDNFTCRYCARCTPEVVLEIDHIVPVAEGGTDDPMNLTTSCWECNRGKSDVPLTETMTGEDPGDRTILLLERERQLREYNVVLADVRERKEREAQDLLNWWCQESGEKSIPHRHWSWLLNELDRTPAETIRRALQVSLAREMTKDLRYTMVVLRNWRDEGKI